MVYGEREVFVCDFCFRSWVVQELPNLFGPTGVAVLDDEFRRGGRVVGERLAFLLLAELGDALDSGQSLRSFERLLVVPVVVKPRNARALVFLGSQWWVRRVRAGDLPPEHRVAEVDKTSLGLRAIPYTELVGILVDFLPHQAPC